MVGWVDSGYVELIAWGSPGTSGEACRRRLGDLMVSWVDSGYVELIAWGSPGKSGEAWGCQLEDLMVGWVDSDSESDGVGGLVSSISILLSY